MRSAGRSAEEAAMSLGGLPGVCLEKTAAELAVLQGPSWPPVDVTAG